MRLCTPLSPFLAAAAAVVAVLVPVSPELARADSGPSCAGSDDRNFPLATRIHGGPGSYEAGGGYGTWYIDLTNTTRRTCAAVHPVVVFVDDKRALKPSQPKLEFYDGPRTRPVRFETTDEKELVGVFDGDGFDGFSVAPGKTVTVKVRLSLTSDAVPDTVTANAAAVQRHGQDGEWVGESNAYRFGIDQDPGTDQDGGVTVPEPDSSGVASTAPSPAPSPAPSLAPSADSSVGPGPRTTYAASDPSNPPVSSDPADMSDPSDPSGRSDLSDPSDPSLPFAQEAQEAGERARELARTGTGLAHGLLAVAATLLAVGTSAFLLARRRR
ncbi:hypothetical protein [Streptomyces sp. NPDC006739]|uniref:hypothetical protein n=1 Tax=Streptomyces sp. NPDC006739 TaxID=3364763 RepID=UPI0036B4337B